MARQAISGGKRAYSPGRGTRALKPRSNNIASLRAPSRVRSGGVNLNPFDSRNIISTAGRNVARGITPLNFNLGNMVSNALEDKIIGNPGRRIKQVTGQK